MGRWTRPILAVALAALVGCSGSTPPTGQSQAPAAPNPTPSPSAPSGPATPSTPASTVAAASAAATSSAAELPSPADILSAGASAINQDGNPDWMILAGGSAWVAAADGIQQLDIRTGAKGKVVPVHDICLAMDAGFGSVWAGDCGANTLHRFDPATATVVSTIPVPGPSIQGESSIAAGEGGVWVVTTNALLVKVDPTTNKVVGQFDLPTGAAAARAGLGSVWVTVSGTGVLARIDPATGHVVSTTPTGAGPRFLAIGAGSVWVMNQQGQSVTRVDPSGAVVATIPVSAGPIDGGDIAVGGGSVWVRTSNELVVKVDPATNSVVAVYGPASGSGSVAADDAAAWVSAHDVSTIWRLPLR